MDFVEFFNSLKREMPRELEKALCAPVETGSIVSFFRRDCYDTLRKAIDDGQVCPGKHSSYSVSLCRLLTITGYLEIRDNRPALSYYVPTDKTRELFCSDE